VTDPLHEDEFLIDLSLVRALVDRALPECASLPLSPLWASGSSNALFRLGDELLIRLPRQPGGIRDHREGSALAAADRATAAGIGT
jgi:hypothetical protein